MDHIDASAGEARGPRGDDANSERTRDQVVVVNDASKIDTLEPDCLNVAMVVSNSGDPDPNPEVVVNAPFPSKHAGGRQPASSEDDPPTADLEAPLVKVQPGEGIADASHEENTRAFEIGAPPELVPVVVGVANPDIVEDERRKRSLPDEQSTTTPDQFSSATDSTTSPESDNPIAHKEEQPLEQKKSGGTRDSETTAAPPQTTTTASPSLGFAASLTASFAPETKSAWAQLFGSRYEDEVDAAVTIATSQDTSSPNQRKQTRKSLDDDASEKSRISLKAKLDQQIQASRQKFKERTLLRNGENTQAQASPKTSRLNARNAAVSIPVRPFELAGLSITNVRFCIEKAFQATCKCFQQLHALAVNEPRIPRSGAAHHGVFLAQWELEQLLHELFGPRDDAASSSPLTFALMHPQYAGVPLELLLQITWFIPFDQLTRLRSLVLQITRKHLSERKLAVLNRHLQKQMLLIPYSTRLQQALLRFSGQCMDEEGEHALIGSAAPPLVHCTHELVRELLECIDVCVPSECITAFDGGEFLSLSPFELVQRWKLSSLLCIQRVVYFRFLVEAIANERTKSRGGRSTSSVRNAMKAAPTARRNSGMTKTVRSVKARTRTSAVKKHAKKAKQSDSSSSDSSSEESCAADSDSSNANKKTNVSTGSVVTAHGSIASSTAASQEERQSPRMLSTKAAEAVKQQRVQQLQRLQQKLLSSLTELGQVMPWVLRDDPGIPPASPAIKATFLAASAFHQSLDIMIKNGLVLECDVVDKLRSFIESLDAIISSTLAATPTDPQLSPHRATSMHPAVAAAMVVATSEPAVQQEVLYPPPYPDLTQEEEKAIFPPPYVSTGPAYWAFHPEIPPSTAAASVAKSKSLSSSHIAPTHPLSGFSFQKAGVDGEPRTPSKADKGSSSNPKPRIYKSSLSRSTSPAVTTGSDGPAFNHQERVGADRESSDIGVLQEDGGVRVVGDTPSRPGEEDGDDDRLEDDIVMALRRQHNMVVNDFMLDILQQNRKAASPSPGRAKHSKTQKAAPELTWKSSSESRFVNRMRNRETAPHQPHHHQQQQHTRNNARSQPSRASTSAGARARPSKQPSREPKQSMKMPLPNGREPPNDEHLAWATRISDFYKAKQSLDDDEWDEER